MKKPNIVNLSTNLSAETKNLLERFCKKRGIKINHFIEKAILESLEDEMDNQLISDRELEDTVVWKKSA